LLANFAAINGFILVPEKFRIVYDGRWEVMGLMDQINGMNHRVGFLVFEVNIFK
jgi:hypothetical protein